MTTKTWLVLGLVFFAALLIVRSGFGKGTASRSDRYYGIAAFLVGSYVLADASWTLDSWWWTTVGLIVVGVAVFLVQSSVSSARSGAVTGPSSRTWLQGYRLYLEW